jgi:hypothetical protein
MESKSLIKKKIQHVENLITHAYSHVLHYGKATPG